MHRILIAIGVLAVAALCPETVSAKKQTKKEATDSLQNIMDMAAKGDAISMNIVGEWFYSGRHVDRNYKEASEWWARAAEKNNVNAIGNLGLCFQYGRGVEPDSLKAIGLYQRSIREGNQKLLESHIEAAKTGSLFSDMLLASCYEKGYGVAKNLNAAISYLKPVAERDNVEAQMKLAQLLETDRQPEEAAEWYRRASANGDVKATYRYGMMLLQGNGMKVNKKEGANYLIKAAEKDMAAAQYELANCYMKGEGLTRSADQAVKWYRLAAGHYIPDKTKIKDNQAVVNSQWTLAQCYREGNGTPVNYYQALYWYGEAVNNGLETKFEKLLKDSIPDSPFVDYMKGMQDYRAQKFDEAMKLFKKVEKAKVVNGKVMQAVILSNKDYSGYNQKKSVKLLQEAANEGSSQAQYFLGKLYESGTKVEGNMPLALQYFRKAAEDDNPEAECALADLYFEGRGVDQNYAMAVELYNKALLQGQISENAARRLASCYDEGKGVPMDKEKAGEILKINTKNHIAYLFQFL